MDVRGYVEANASEFIDDLKQWLTIPSISADPARHGTRTGTFIVLNFAKKLVLIGGTTVVFFGPENTGVPFRKRATP